ncbi:hypothetical protein Rhopal_001951-T1 [Rhodotorula paludigena]|uniref:Uncharacterized protein n=1 Tax=Rhodotorula paludigena TaxID=86838 RepID=A0AAV5GHI2_9BASI|nr:hypothetical protein Rhopal_001951-T1 [Rhodotorula paludigena]
MSANDDQAARDARKLVPVATQSSAGSDVSSAPSSPSRKSAGSSFKLSSLHHALSRPAHSSSAHKRHHPHYDDPDYTLPPIRDPIHLCETAISLMLSVPGPTVDQLRQRFIPQLYHVSAYQHRVNTREVGMEELLKVMDRYRQRFSHLKVRFRSHLMDMDGTASMHAAAVGLVYDITGRPKAPSGHHDVEERRASSICVMKIYEGKIAQTDMVVDTKELQPDHQGPELNCSIM